MRSKEPSARINQKKKLSSDASILAALIKKQPLGKKDLTTESNIDDSTFSRAEPLLLSKGLIKRVNDKYCLFNYEGDEVLEELFNKLEKEGTKLVILEKVANMVGRPPEEIKDQVYRLAHKHNMNVYYPGYSFQ